MEHPDQRARLAADPSLLPTAIEEMLRYISPVTVFVRTATKDTELAFFGRWLLYICVKFQAAGLRCARAM
jgi:hypothetical protein